VGPRAVLDAVVKRKIPSPHRESNPRTTDVQPVDQRYTDRAITAMIIVVVVVVVVIIIIIIIIIIICYLSRLLFSAVFY
jgi:hypothetical protein